MIRFIELLLKGLSRLPLVCLYGMGVFLGMMAFYLFPTRRRIAQINLARSFPNLSPMETDRLLKKTFRSLGIGVLETVLAWFAPKERLQRICNISGLLHIQEALQLGKGVILVSPHVVTFELGGRLLSEHFPLTAMYRKQNQGWFNTFMERARTQHYLDLIPKTDVRKLLRYLGQNQVVAYLADQAPPKKRRVYVPWFGIPVATHTALSHMTRLSGAAMLPTTVIRLPGGKYALRIDPPIADFDKKTKSEAAVCLNQFMESSIRAHPEQYFWVHRCFKKLPDEKINYYARASLKPAALSAARYKRLLRFFKTSKGGYSLRHFASKAQAQRFVRNTNQLIERGIDAAQIVRFFTTPSHHQHVVITRLTGQDVLELVKSGGWNKILQSQLALFVTRLHQKGICVREMRPENIVLQPNQLFALDDASDICFSKCPLTVTEHATNLINSLAGLPSIKNGP